jgi:hypothetical protein
MNWKGATLVQLYHILFSENCPDKYKLEARIEIDRRLEAKRANVWFRDKGRNHG